MKTAPISAETARALFRERYRVHPLADALPPLSDADLLSLAASIADRGLQIPAIQDRSGAILDGRHRLTACILAGVDPEIEIRAVAGVDALRLVADLNATRRHLTASQRALAAARAHACTHSISQGALASAWGVSRRSVSYALELLAGDDPELIASVESGAIGLRPAVESARSPGLSAAEASELYTDAPAAPAAPALTVSAPSSDLSRVSATSEDGAPPPPASTSSARDNRRALDAYYTPPALALACVATICDLLEMGEEVLEPQAGGGAFVDALLQIPSLEVVACDLNPSAPGLDRGFVAASIAGDALSLAGPYPWVIGNPPYGAEAEDQVRHALEISEMGCAFLLRSDWIARRLRDPSLRPSVCYAISPRPSFGALDPSGEISWPGGTDATEYVWAIWLHGYEGPTVWEPLIWSGPDSREPQRATRLLQPVLAAPAAEASASQRVSVQALADLLQAALASRSGELLDLIVQAWEAADPQISLTLARALLERASWRASK